MIPENTEFSQMHFHMLGVGGMGMAPLAIFFEPGGLQNYGRR